MTDAERYLRKAQQSIASAKADVRARRYNSAANRAYYAVFQAAVAALLHWRIRGVETDWQHRSVGRDFSGTLVKQLKLLPAQLNGVLAELFELRIIGDYRAADVSKRGATYAERRAAEMVSAVSGAMARRSMAEAGVSNATKSKRSTKSPGRYVDEVKARIHESYPDVEFRVTQRAPRDFTLEVLGDYDEMWQVRQVLGDMTADALVDADVWIVVLGLDGQAESS